MTPPPSLTLVITAHRPQHLREAIASVAAQTSTHFDVVCCADATSGYPVADMLRELAPSIPCRRVEVLDVQGGTAGRVRNAGFAAAATQWVAYLDGDDMLYPDALATVQAAIDSGQADILSTGMARIDGTGRHSVLPASLRYRPPQWIYRIDPDTVGHATFFNQLLAIRRALWHAGPFYEETNGEDIDFMLHQLLNGTFRKIPVALYGYRDTPDSFSKQHFTGGDLCARRYESGYYQRLFERRYRVEVAGNFAEEPDPQ